MIDVFAPLEGIIADLETRLSPNSRRALARDIATDLRSINAARIRANKTPEGAAMEPRKDKRGRKGKAAAMFRRAAGARYLRKKSTAGEAEVGYVGAMARIMRVHHYGLRDTVTRAKGSPEVTYPERPVIGMTAEDRLRLLDKVAAIVGA